jgi:non-ribosomal peptide synthetase component F
VSDLVIGMPIADRRRVEFEGVIGLFTNVMVLRFDLTGSPAFLELIKRVRRALSDAYTQQDLPYGSFVQAQADATGRPPAAPFRVTFNFVNGASELRLRMPGLGVQELRAGQSPPALADLALLLWEDGGALACALSYNDALFTEPQVQRFAGQLIALAHASAVSPTDAIGDLVRHTS